MSTFEIFLWVAFPWLCIGLCVIGFIWRWRTDQFGWTTHSSQIYESKILRLASPLFHYGIILVVFGHILGLGIPNEWTRAVGVSDGVYHWIAVVPGVIAGVMTTLGIVGLLYRRIKHRTVFLSTSGSDKVMYLFLALAIFTGFWATLQTQVFTSGHGYDYRETISPWIRQLLVFNPHPELMTDVPVAFKLHVIAGFTLFAIAPFTRLVHVLSAPVGYLTRPYVVYRSRDVRTTPRRGHEAWEPIRSRTEQLDQSEAPSRGA